MEESVVKLVVNGDFRGSTIAKRILRYQIIGTRGGEHHLVRRSSSLKLGDYASEVSPYEEFISRAQFNSHSEYLEWIYVSVVLLLI